MDLKALLASAKVELFQASATLRDDVHALVSDYLQIYGQLRTNVVDAVLAAVVDRGVASIVVEREYVDADYLQTYSQHYSKAFRPQVPVCMRLHFFAARIAEADLFQLSVGQKAAYLGYCVVRPTGNQFIGRTIVAPPRDIVAGNGLVHATAQFETNLLGQRLVVDGMPFIQQDVSTFICAGAALWSIGLFLHRTIGTPRFYPGEISEIALRHFAQAQLREGLTIAQMVMTLREMGLNPHVQVLTGLQQLKKTDPPAYAMGLAQMIDFLAVFADSGLPPILAVSAPDGEGHAVAVAGHDVVERHIPIPNSNDPVRSWIFLDRFLVMDDANGPYRPIHTTAGSGAVLGLESADSIAVIAPVPVEVATECRDAIQEAEKLVPYWNSLMDRFAADTGQAAWLGHRVAGGPDGPPVIRRVLMDSRKWKQCVIASRMPGWLKAIYQAMLLPKYIWVVELSDWGHFNRPTHPQRELFGEAILDATANPQHPLGSVISFQAHGLMIDTTDPAKPEFRMASEPFVPYSPVCQPHAR